MANDRSGQGSIDLNADPTALGSLHVKSVKEAAKLADYLPIRWDELPKMPFYGRFFGYNDTWYRATVAMSVLGMRSRAQRMLSQDEVQILANMTAGLTTRMSYEFPVMLATGVFMERRTRATFGFPFFQPREGFDPNVFPTKTTRLVEGPLARPLWHMVRFSLYTTVAHFALRTVFFGYGTAVNSYVFENDPRLADLRQSLKAALGAKRGAATPGQNEIDATSAAAGQSTYASRMRETVERQKQAAERRQQERDAQRRGVQPDSQQQLQLQQERQEQEQYQGEQQYPQYQEYQQRQPQQQQRQQQPQQQQQPQAQSYDGYSNDLDDDFNDDASPVSPSERRKGWRQQPASGTGEGTAWDRLRAPGTSNKQPVAISQAPPGQYGWEALRKGKSPPQPPQQQQDNSNRPTTGDYTFNEADEEKAYARNQAQKDFDAMLEKERQGESDKPSRRW